MVERHCAPLLGLPPEVLGILYDTFHRRDLNQISQTCKTLNSSAIPRLYKHVFIQVPMQWSRLPSLEALVGSSGESTQFIRSITVSTQQDPLREDQTRTVESRLPSVMALGGRPLFVLPAVSASNALNVLIRLLIARLPKHRLRDFA